jgi:hypothetical protein
MLMIRYDHNLSARRRRYFELNATTTARQQASRATSSLTTARQVSMPSLIVNDVLKRRANQDRRYQRQAMT